VFTIGIKSTPNTNRLESISLTLIGI